MPPVGKLSKVKSYKKTFKDLFNFSKPYKLSLIIVILLGIVTTVIYTFIPMFMRDLVNNL